MYGGHPNQVQLNQELPILQKSHLAQEIHPLDRFEVVVLEQVFSAVDHQIVVKELNVFLVDQVVEVSLQP